LAKNSTNSLDCGKISSPLPLAVEGTCLEYS
jgi:hypothetical protein